MAARRLSLILSALVATCASPAFAQEKPWTLHEALDAPDNLKLSGSIRLRQENLDGQYRAGADPSDSLTSLRTLIFAEYKTGQVRFGGEIQDSRGFGGKLGGAVSANDVNALEPIQAYVARDFREPFGPGTSATAQAGRFTLNLGSRRLVAADDYRNTTNGYTGLRLDAKGRGGLAATFIYTLPQVRLPEDKPSVIDNEVKFDLESADLALWGGLVSKPLFKGGPLVEASFFALDEADAPGRPTRDRDLDTVGARIIQNPAPGSFDYEAEYIHQTGSIRASLSPTARILDVEAHFLHVDFGYSFKGAWSPRVSFDYDYASGDDADPSFGRFDALFGMRRGELAPSGIYAAIGRTNLNAPGIRVEVTPSKRLDGFFTYKALWAASETDSFSSTGLRPPAGTTDRYAGQQIDGRLRYWVIPDSLRLEVTAVILFDKGRMFESVRTKPTRYGSIALTKSF